METVTNQPVQTEVSLRTLASDLKSIEHGQTAPVSEAVKITAQAETNETAEAGLAKPKKTLKNVILVIVLMAILAVGYFYIYPMLRSVLTPSL